MSFRVVNGSTHTEDGWRCVNVDECDLVRIPELYLTETAPLRKGAPLIILGAWLYWYDRNVEEIDSPVWGWSKDNDVLGQWGKNNGSNHLSGTAIDVNAPKYPWGENKMSQAKVDKVEEGLRLFRDMVYWGRWWDYPDEMHYQMALPEGDRASDLFAQELLDGYLGIYKKIEPQPEPETDLVQLLSEVMGNQSNVDYGQYVIPFTKCLRDCECNTPQRISMLSAQVGHESEGLIWTKEIWGPTAQQLTYQGRMGNNNPGDGERYQGRSFMQVTGKDNYRKLSQWAFDNGYTDSPTLFIDDPYQLSTPAYAFLGVTWYWTTHNLNAAADAGNVELATQIINGGQTGLSDRRSRYNYAMSMGQRLMAFVDEPTQTPEQGEDWMSDVQTLISRSMFADSAVPFDVSTVGMLLNTDGNAWNLVNILGVLLGVDYSVTQVKRMANGDFPAGTQVGDDPWLRALATDFAKKLEPLAGSLAKFLKAVNEAGETNVKP